MATKTLTELSTANLIRPGPKRREIPDRGCRGLYLIVQPKGNASWAVRYRASGKPVKLTLGAVLVRQKGEPVDPSVTSALTLAAARKAASEALNRVDQGVDPAAGKRLAKAAAAASTSGTFAAVAKAYMAREGAKLRSRKARQSCLDRLVIPVIGARPIGAIKRSEIIDLLDQIEDERGRHAADMALAFVSRILNWHSRRDDDFRSPIHRGVDRRTNVEQRSRNRVLSDDEICSLWAATAGAVPFHALIRFLLLTAARRSEASELAWTEIDGSDWTLPAARNKVKVDLLRPLSKDALAIVSARPRLDDCEFVFSNGRRPIQNFSKWKAQLDKASGVAGWRLHDLRRTARTLMSRAGVSVDIAERCLGHVVGGIRGVYDKYEYASEKAAAYEMLAALVARIIDPADSVVAIGERRAAS